MVVDEKEAQQEEAEQKDEKANHDDKWMARVFI